MLLSFDLYRAKFDIQHTKIAFAKAEKFAKIVNFSPHAKAF